MRHQCLALALIFTAAACAQETPAEAGMTQQRLHNVIVAVGDDVFVADNVVQFTYDGMALLCISDVAADRMRIISPIAELGDVESEQLLLALAANFHTALDARYALSDGVIYAAYIHPLSPLSNDELVSAIRQVATASQTFGTEYTSGALSFGGTGP